VEFLAEEKEIALVRAADQFVRGGGIVILIGGLLSTVSALNATIYSSSRVAFAMARDANLPQVIGRVHARRATPHVAVVLSAAIVIGMAVLLPIEDVAAATDIMFLLLFVQVNVAAIRLRKLRPDLDRGFRVPLMPLVPLLAVAMMSFLAVYLFTHYPLGWVAVGAWLLIGAGVYYGYSRRHEVAHEEREEWMERIERKEYRVLAAVSSPRTMPSLLEAAIAIAQGHDSEIVVLTVAEVPEGESLMAGRRLVHELEPLLEEARDYVAGRGVSARAVLKIARRVSYGIIQTVREEQCNFLLLGRPVTGSMLERLVASIVERVLQDAPCQVGVVYGTLAPNRIGGVAVPVTAGANPRLAASLAPAFARRFDAPLRGLTVIAPGAPEEEVRQLEAAARETLQASNGATELTLVRARDVAQGLAAAVRADELIVVGAPRIDPVAGLLGTTVPGALAALGRNPVVVVRDLTPARVRRFERFFLLRK
jgi:nucleotide-binding universal stress UspA family protein